MQTFLPLPDYKESLRCLDPTRLGNQVYREAYTLYKGGWPNHPASKMWSGCKYHLGLYILVGCEVLDERGKPVDWLVKEITNDLVNVTNTDPPWWVGYETFHNSHKSNLLRKDYDHYSQFGWLVPTDLPYYWPKVS